MPSLNRRFPCVVGIMLTQHMNEHMAANARADAEVGVAMRRVQSPEADNQTAIP